MKISVYGSGYVGLVMAACLAEVGHEVICVDIDPQKIDRLKAGDIPIYEPDLQNIVEKTQAQGLLSFTTDSKIAVLHGECQFIAVGTPPDGEGRADLSAVMAVADTIAVHMNQYTIIINKSTVPVGTADKVRERLLAGLKSRHLLMDTPLFDVVSNPEFLKQGAAVNDFRHPDRIILGMDSPRPEAALRALYQPFCQQGAQCLVMDCRSAELVKYAANVLLATKISFMNEMAHIAEAFGADIDEVRRGISLDPRIGPHFLQAGVGYGGSCFGKDIQALIHTARDQKTPHHLIEAVEKVNQLQKLHLVEKILKHYQYDVSHCVFAVWGLAFKPNTNDMRDAPSQTVIRALLQQGAIIQAHDPKAMGDAQRIFGDIKGLHYSPNPMSALEGAQALIILTEWAEFKSIALSEIKTALQDAVIFDGRNIINPINARTLGFGYYGIGR